MESVKKLFKNDKFAGHVGIELVQVSAGRAKVRMKVTKEHLNGVNIVHGGAIFTLADLALAIASNSHGTVAVAINASISFLKAVTGGTLTAEAEEVSLDPKLAAYKVSVTDDRGGIVAIFQGTVYRKKERVND